MWAEISDDNIQEQSHNLTFPTQLAAEIVIYLILVPLIGGDKIT